MTGEDRKIILDRSEKERRNAIWNKMTKEERQKAEDKKTEIMEWALKEEAAAFEKIKSEGRWHGGMDGYYPEMVAIHEERKRRLHELLISLFGEET